MAMHPEDARGEPASPVPHARTLTMHPEDERDVAPRMTPNEAVDAFVAHVEAVRRGDPEALEVDRELNKILRERDAQRKAREKLTADITHDLVELSDFDLMRVKLFVGRTLETARAAGTARKLDAESLAAEQQAREVGP